MPDFAGILGNILLNRIPRQTKLFDKISL